MGVACKVDNVHRTQGSKDCVQCKHNYESIDINLEVVQVFVTNILWCGKFVCAGHPIFLNGCTVRSAQLSVARFTVDRSPWNYPVLVRGIGTSNYIIIII